MNSRNQVHSGVYNLDYFICGGYPVGGVTLIGENDFEEFGNFWQVSKLELELQIGTLARQLLIR